MPTRLEIEEGGRFSFAGGWEGTISEIKRPHHVQFDVDGDRRGYLRFEVEANDGGSLFSLIDRMGDGEDVNEKQLDAAVRELATLFGWLRYHTFDSRRSPRGFPDLVLVRPPRLIAAELKAENGRLTAKQAEWLDALGRCPGIETYVWRPQDLDHVASMLSRNWGKGQPFAD